MPLPQELVGCIVKHREFGLARITTLEERSIVLTPFEKPDHAKCLSLPAALQDLERHRIPDGGRARSSDGFCTIERSNDGYPCVYDILRDDGVREQVPETRLEPVSEPPATTVKERFVRLDFDRIRFFRGREELIHAVETLERKLAGLRPLLASRIDIYPHQAFVAGAVLLDHYRRYLLADEVGLGKTIEAGIVAQDVLAGSEGARILVVCPGSLTLQWLAEFYGKFGGRVFTILDMVSSDQPRSYESRLSIASTSFVLTHASLMDKLPRWDLLIVDEAHRLLHSALYDQIARMSARSNALLLLSALPARRIEELYKLLRLLDPEFYETPSARENFDEIYANQRVIGRRIRLVERRVREFRNGDEPAEAVVESASRLRTLPIVVGDVEVSEAFGSLDVEAHDLADRAEGFAHLVADRYRISRRIFRNRRERLIEEGQMPRIERRLEQHIYAADQVEFEAGRSVVALIESAHSKGVAPDFGIPFARMLLQGLADPSTTAALLNDLSAAKARGLNEKGRELVAEGHLSGYADAALHQQLVFTAVRAFVDGVTLKRAMSDVRDWLGAGQSARLKALLRLLKTRSNTQPKPKCLIFAGHPGLAESLAETLTTQFGTAAVTQFRYDLSPRLKEENVLRFKSRPDTWILISDETGGEGRNFQYVDEIFHFDLPWNASALEQRIGRLDRIGRKNEVVSQVITSDGSIEHAFLHCLDEGLGLFRQSISGLELALRSIEDDILRCVMETGDAERLWSLAEGIRETASAERATDEADAVLDAACFNRQRAERFARIRYAVEDEQRLMSGFINHWKLMAPGGVRIVNDDLAPGDVVEFDADRVVHGGFDLPEALRTGNRRFQGSFKRAAVRDRPSLEFFGPGNAFFDAVTGHASNSLFGRVYAVEIEDRDRDTWIGIEVACRAIPDVSLVDKAPYWLGRVRQTFPTVRCSAFVELESGRLCEPPELLELRNSVVKNGGHRTWWDLSTSEVGAYARSVLVAGTTWREVIDQRIAAGISHAREVVQSQVQIRLMPELERLDSEMRRLSTRGKTETDERRSLHALRESLKNWTVSVEALGLLSRNGKLRTSDGS